MHKCLHCGIQITSGSIPGKCPRCPNMEKFEHMELARVCSKCQTTESPYEYFPIDVIANDTSGKCLICEETEIDKFGGMTDDLIAKIKSCGQENPIFIDRSNELLRDAFDETSSDGPTE